MKRIFTWAFQTHNLLFFLFLTGNGPSGICLSYLLNGYSPYLDPKAVHPNPILFRKLQEAKQLPITEQVKWWQNSYYIFYLRILWTIQICGTNQVPVCLLGLGVSLWRFRGTFRKPCGSALRHTPSSKCRSRFRVSLCFAVETWKETSHSSSGPGQSYTWWCLACEWTIWVVGIMLLNYNCLSTNFKKTS